jgi:hypothetical protein
VNVPAGSKRSVNTRIASGPLGSDRCAEGAAVIRNPAKAKAMSARLARGGMTRIIARHAVG